MKNDRMSRSKKDRKLSRRTFLKLSALTGSVLSVSHLAVPFGASPAAPPQPAAQIPQKEQWISTSCLNCSSRCATRVRTVNGKAVRVVGNPLSRVSDGKTCPRSRIGLQVLYDKERINVPLKRTSKDKGRDINPGWAPISWGQALDEVASRLKS